jgi:DNA polymerase-3 subunit chi
MTKVDFYTGSPDKLRTVCQLSQKAIHNGVRTVISLPDATTVDALDKLLWHYPPSAFIPHSRNNAVADGHEPADSSDWPVILDHGGDRFPHHELLINLHDECMPFFSRFERVIEIIGNSEEDSRAGRERFRFYRDRGYELHHIDLSRNQNT